MKNYKIIIIDQKRIMKKIKGLLEHEGFIVSSSNPCSEIPVATPSINELVRFDILLPEESMASTFQKIHSFSSAPFFILSARINNSDQLVRMERGIRDNFDSLFYQPAVEHYLKAEPSPKRLFAGPIFIDLENHKVSVLGSEIHLTPTEFNLLRFLATNPGKVCTRHELLGVFDGPYAKNRNRSLDCHIAHIRKKISRHFPGRNVIHAVYGTGYTLRIPKED